jgi:hypothetical protein
MQKPRQADCDGECLPTEKPGPRHSLFAGNMLYLCCDIMRYH